VTSTTRHVRSIPDNKCLKCDKKQRENKTVN